MRIAFRLDISTTIGTGHLARCLSLSKELGGKGGECVFFVKSNDVDLSAYDTSGATVEQLDYSVSDKNATATLLKDHGPFDWLIVDHYGLDRPWEEHVHAFVPRIMVIDDLNRDHHCDLLLDQNFFRDQTIRYPRLRSEGVPLLIGPEYALLRSEFRGIPHRVGPRKDTTRVNLFFGGADASNLTTIAIEAIRSLQMGAIAADVIVGSANPHRRAVKKLCDSLRWCTYHEQVSNIAELFMRADIGFGAGGSAVWEKCAVGLPTVAVCVADNQIGPMEELEHIGAIILHKGDHDTSGFADILKRSINSPHLDRVAAVGRKLYDGMGTERVANALERWR